MESQVIAVVSDSDAAVLCHILARQNLNVVPVHNTNEALTYLESIGPALLLLDLHRTGTEAEGLCRAIRRTTRTRYVPVLILSPTDKPCVRVAAFQAGADDFLGKPFDPKELLLRVYALLRRSAHNKLLNPVTGLPTLVLFRQELESRLARSKEGALIYCELEGIDAFRERHGFEKGDRMLALLAQTLLETSAVFGQTQDILGHVGDDGFAIFTACPELREYARRINQEFDDRVLTPAGEEDGRDDAISKGNRGGLELHFPDLRVAIGIARCSDLATCNYARLLELAKEAGSVAKGIPNAGYFINRRACPMSNRD